MPNTSTIIFEPLDNVTSRMRVEYIPYSPVVWDPERNLWRRCMRGHGTSDKYTPLTPESENMRPISAKDACWSQAGTIGMRRSPPPTKFRLADRKVMKRTNSWCQSQAFTNFLGQNPKRLFLPRLRGVGGMFVPKKALLPLVVECCGLRRGTAWGCSFGPVTPPCDGSDYTDACSRLVVGIRSSQEDQCRGAILGLAILSGVVYAAGSINLVYHPVSGGRLVSVGDQRTRLARSLVVIQQLSATGNSADPIRPVQFRWHLGRAQWCVASHPRVHLEATAAVPDRDVAGQ